MTDDPTKQPREAGPGAWLETARIRFSVDPVPISILLLGFGLLRDEHGEINDWILRDANADALREMGLPLERLAGRPASELFDSDAYIELFREVAATGKPRRLEMYLPWSGKHFLMTVAPAGDQWLIGVAMESDPASGFESRLAYLASFPEQNPNPVVGLDLDGRILYANPATLALFPDLHEQGPAHPWLADWEEVAGQFRAGGAETILREQTIGERSYEQAICYFAQDRLVRIHSVDITERKLHEDALRAKQEELMVAYEQLQAQQEELTAANEELQAQQEEMTAANEELQAQQEELNTAYQELRDLTEIIREHAEQVAQSRDEAERRAAELDATISSIAAGVIIYDVAGKITRINEFGRNLLGYTGADYALPFQDRIARLGLRKGDGTPHEEGKTPLERALQGEVIRDEEMMLIKDDGSAACLSANLAPIHDQRRTFLGVVFFFTDITERRRKVEDRLASERELLKVTLNSLGEGVVATDREERIMLINAAAAQLTGYSEAEAIQEPIGKILYVIDDQTGEPLISGASFRTSNQPVLVTRNLEEIPIAMHRSPIETADGRIIGSVTVFQDVSEKQKTERELLKAEKLESLGVLAGGIAHDFNNILSAIISNIQLALMKLEKNQDIKSYLLNTVETTRKASDLTKQLLTFSKGGAPVRKNASLIELIKDTAEFVLRGAKTKAEYTIPDDLWAASVDEGQISQVIHNLVLNAKQAMPKGGIIHISAENIIVETDRRLRPGQYVQITVTDCGTGIAKENLPKIFDPFFTTKKDGNGLGLATSYSIITRHNGSIDVESQEGAGTTFFIRLPASDGLLEPAEFQSEVAAAGAGFHILFMDDEEAILNAVGEMLKCHGHRVVTSTDGAEAIGLYQQACAAGDPFDAVIMDLTVPGGMGGQEAITLLRDFDPDIKAIVSSGYANDPIMSDYERYGFVGVVSKPYKVDELNEVLHRVIDPA
jgi:PAS domain S-box-containing protein